MSQPFDKAQGSLGPYELNQIYCCECSEGMAALPDGCIDMWLTSPPYDSIREYRGFTFDFERIAAQLYRVTKPGGVGVWVVADETKDGSESGTSFRQALGFMAAGFNLHDTMIYEVAGTGAKGSNLAYWQAFEFMLVLSKGIPKTVNRIADQKNKTIGLLRGGRFRAGGSNEKSHPTNEFGIRTNIWRYTVGFADNSDKTDHPAPFPEALARDHILSWSNPGDVVLDPLMGSGTVGKMCVLLDRNFLGFEISQEYVDLANRRIAQVKAQPKLIPYEAIPQGDTKRSGKPAQLGLLLDKP